MCSKIVTDASVLVTFNIAVMLNDRLDLSKEFLSQSFLNFSLILVNILIPASVVVEQLCQNKKKGKSASRILRLKVGKNRDKVK